MPIVDGVTSTKMIRSHEKTHRSGNVLSTRAALNGRIPIIAVSASLLEKQRELYIDGGFDGWILKPIAFNRLSVIMTGLVDQQVRKQNLYLAGKWESGGWFAPSEDRGDEHVDTTPSGQPPVGAPVQQGTSEGMKVAAASANPVVREESESLQSREQNRLLEAQKTQRAEDLGESGSTRRSAGEGEDEGIPTTITTGEAGKSRSRQTS